MTSAEIVKCAINFETPPRLPVLMESLGVSDRASYPLNPSAGFSPAEEGLDEWGCLWKKTEIENMGQIVRHPLEDISGLEQHPMPDYTDASRYDDAVRFFDQADAEGKYIICGIFMILFERMHALHGFENTLVDLYTERSIMETLADRIVDTHVALVEEIAYRFPGRLHAWSMTDDWGTQQAAFIGMDFWMDFFFPRYKRIFDAMHNAGCDVWVHSCGKINEIIEGYIKAGVDVVNLQQPRALGIEDIGKQYQGRITFESLADIQATLPTADKQEIEADAEALMTHWASLEGGFLFSDYGNGAAIGIKDNEVKPLMYNAFSRWSEKIYGNPLPHLPST